VADNILKKRLDCISEDFLAGIFTGLAKPAWGALRYMFGKVVTGKSTLVTDMARSLRADSSRAEAKRAEEKVSGWLGRWDFSKPLNPWLLGRAEASDDETYAVDFSDISKEFGGEGMEGMAMGWDGSRGVTAMGHDFICMSLVGARWREAQPVYANISTEDNFTSYVVMTNRETTSPTLLVNTANGLLGMDNWTRLLGGGTFCVIDSGDDGKNELRVSGGGNGIVAQTLGETIVSGKVRISADVRLPTEWNVKTETDARVCLALGSPTYWSLGDTSGYTGRHAGYGAIVGESKDEFHPAYIPPNGATLVSAKDTSVACTGKTWYRMVVTADLGAKTYDYELYEIGTYSGAIDRTDVPSTPVYATNSIPFRNNISSIGSFGLYSYRQVRTGTTTSSGTTSRCGRTGIRLPARARPSTPTTSTGARGT
jgi:hypothetical protein